MKLRRRRTFLFSVLCLLSSGYAGTLVSGPMLGYQAHREVFLWVETKDAQKVTLDYWLAGRPETKQTIERTGLTPTPAGGQIAQFRPSLLEMGATYDYTLSIDGVAQKTAAPAKFRTRALWEWRTPPPDFKFITGSCAYINEPVYDRPGEPYGRTVETFKLLGDSGADFMVWLGDNWYWREADFDSVSASGIVRHTTAPSPRCRSSLAQCTTTPCGTTTTSARTTPTGPTNTRPRR